VNRGHIRLQGSPKRSEGEATSTIQNGDVVVIQECPEPTNGTVVVAEVGGEVTLKTWSQKGNKVRLIPANPDYAETEIQPDQVKCVGEMIGLLR